MGLDGVEIVMGVEDHFGITIADSEASQIRTVGDMLALIESRCRERTAGTCDSLPAFLSVRGLTREFLAAPNLRLRPSTPIAAVIPSSRRREWWERLSILYGTAVPELRRPAFVRYFLLGATCIAIAVALSTAFIDPEIIPFGLAVAAVVIFLLHVATRPFRLVPPTRFATFGDATKKLVGLKHTNKPVETHSILPDLQRIIANTLGVDRDEVIPTARFVEDLLCD